MTALLGMQNNGMRDYHLRQLDHLRAQQLALPPGPWQTGDTEYVQGEYIELAKTDYEGGC